MKLTIRKLFLIILFCGIFYLSIKPIVDPDFWWHLRTGQFIDQTRSIPNADPFSLTAFAKPWVAHEWLSEIFIYKSFELAGFGMLILIFSVVITASFIFSYFRCPDGSKPYTAGFAVLFCAISSAPIWGVRPQMFNLFFVSIFLFLLDRYRLKGNFKTLLPLPFIMILWVNMHAGYILGIAVQIVFIFGYFLEMIIKKCYKKEIIDKASQKAFVYLLFVLVICLLATLINPAGYQILAYPFQTLTDSAMQTYISEWFSPDFHQPIWQPFALMILVLIGAGMASNRPISITKILLTLIFGYGALRSIRNIPLFAVVVVPVLAEQFSHLIRFEPKEHEESHHFRFISLGSIITLVLLLALGFFRVVTNQPLSEAENFPKDAIEWIIENKPEGNLFNSYNWGGYLIWKLYPDYPVYIDGRADLYGKDFVSKYTEIYFSKPGWEEKLEQENIRIAFVESDAMIANALRQSSLWEKSYEDELSIIFLRK